MFDPYKPPASGWWHWAVYDIPATAAALGAGGHIALFVAGFCVIMSKFGGAFATVPALSVGHVRHGDGRCHPRPGVDRVVHGWRHRAIAHERNTQSTD
jgi:phosphatidylethanolamine-binding protein (PEBP) family uncharacterized protein